MTHLCALALMLALTGPTAYAAATLAGLRLDRRDRLDAHRLQDDRDIDAWLAAIRRIR